MSGNQAFFCNDLPLYAHPVVGGHALSNASEKRQEDATASLSSSPSLSINTNNDYNVNYNNYNNNNSYTHLSPSNITTHVNHPSFPVLQGLFQASVDKEKIQYCHNGRLLNPVDHSYFASLLLSLYIDNPAQKPTHMYASIDNINNNNNVTFYQIDYKKFEENTISVGYIKGKNITQKFPSAAQRTKKSSHTVTVGNKVIKYNYICIPAMDNKWFEHRWKIKCQTEGGKERGGNYYLCVDVPGTGIKRKRTTTTAPKNKTKKFHSEIEIPPSTNEPSSLTWCMSSLSYLSSPSLSVTSPSTPASSLPSPTLSLPSPSLSFPSPTLSRSSSFSSLSSLSSPPTLSPTSTFISSPFPINNNYNNINTNDTNININNKEDDTNYQLYNNIYNYENNNINNNNNNETISISPEISPVIPHVSRKVVQLDTIQDLDAFLTSLCS